MNLDRNWRAPHPVWTRNYYVSDISGIQLDENRQFSCQRWKTEILVEINSVIHRPCGSQPCQVIRWRYHSSKYRYQTLCGMSSFPWKRRVCFDHSELIKIKKNSIVDSAQWDNSVPTLDERLAKYFPIDYESNSVRPVAISIAILTCVAIMLKNTRITKQVSTIVFWKENKSWAIKKETWVDDCGGFKSLGMLSIKTLVRTPCSAWITPHQNERWEASEEW